MFYAGKRVTDGVLGFFLSPDGIEPCVELTEEQHRALFDGQASGKRICWQPDGTPYLDDPPPPTLEQITAQYTDAVQARLDAFASTRGYDGILAAGSYVTSTNQQYRAEAEYCISARDLTWAAFFDLLAAVEAGERDTPTLDELLAELPELAWPTPEGDLQ